MSKEKGFEVVTDTTSDIPEDLAKEYEVNVIPYYIHMNDKEYKEGIDIEPESIWDYLKNNLNHLPKTACPGVGEYYEAFKKIIEKGKNILSIHITSWGSGAYQSATTAKNILASEYPEAKIEVFDSKSVSLGTGLLALEAAKASLKGWNLSETIEHLKEIRKSFFHSFTNDTLKYLAAGGRIGKAKLLLAEALKINPIISIDEDGVLYALDKAMGRLKAYQKIVEHMQNFFKEKNSLNIALVYANALDELENLKNEILKHFTVKDVIISKLGAALSVHSGPGTIGVLAYPSELSLDK
ncbi:MAG: fatty acid-binding protein DegV [Dictyoglomus sp. NZ13-RE01]|nr:MAG: fatty acid-binding protein DegV [Dictyoglomus sp. NZ13-RE01]